jgi:hypothetical protein
MNTSQLTRLLRGVLLATALVAAAAHAQTVPPPGVGAARPPTERTLQPVDRSQTREKQRESRDCSREAAEITAQYRIQEKSLHVQYESKLAAAGEAGHKALEAERDTKIAQLKREGKEAAARVRDHCRADNASMLQNTGASLDRPLPP